MIKMVKIFNILLTILLIHNVNASTLQGSNRITSHAYETSVQLINKHPPMCGYLKEGIDLNRITAVQNLNSKDCFSCLKVSTPLFSNKTIYVLAVDSGGQGLDLCIPAFKELFGEETGRFQASWEKVDDAFCYITKKVSQTVQPTQVTQVTQASQTESVSQFIQVESSTQTKLMTYATPITQVLNVRPSQQTSQVVPLGPLTSARQVIKAAPLVPAQQVWQAKPKNNINKYRY